MAFPLPSGDVPKTLRLSGFRKFLLRGSVVDLAVGIVIGAAFKSVIDALVSDFITPLVNIALAGHTEFANRYVLIGGSKFGYGDFVNNVLSFVIIAAVVYYVVLIPMNRLIERFNTAPDVATANKTCPECKSQIPFDATRCAFCTVELPAAPAPR